MSEDKNRYSRFIMNLKMRLDLIRIACAKRMIYPELERIVLSRGLKIEDVRGNLDLISWLAADADSSHSPNLPDYSGRLGSLENFSSGQYSRSAHSETQVAQFLGNLVTVRSMETVVEVGCYLGWTSAHLALALHHNNRQGRLYCVDVSAEILEAHRSNLEKIDLGQPVHRICGESLAARTLNELPDEVDMIFLDTAHTYPETWEEIQAYRKRLSLNGILCLHDSIRSPGVRRSIQELSPDVGIFTMATQRGCGLTLLQFSSSKA